MTLPYEGRRVLVLDHDTAQAEKFISYLEDLKVEIKHIPAAASPNSVISFDPDCVILNGERPGEESTGVSLNLRELLPKDVPLAIVYAGVEDSADRRAARARADFYLLRPVRRAVLVNSVRSMLEIRALRQQVRTLEEQLGTSARGQQRPTTQSFTTLTDYGLDPVTKFYRFEFFKRILFLEIKRAFRYEFPLAIVHLAYDNYQEVKANLSSRDMHDIVDGGLALAISKGIRDLDIAVSYSPGHILVLLPHTPADGAHIVADRLRKRIEMLSIPDAGRTLKMTASVGVAAYSGKGKVNFGEMMKAATYALRQATLAGGNRVVVQDSSAPEV